MTGSNTYDRTWHCHPKLSLPPTNRHRNAPKDVTGRKISLHPVVRVDVDQHLTVKVVAVEDLAVEVASKLSFHAPISEADQPVVDRTIFD